MSSEHLNTRFTKSRKSGDHLSPSGEGGVKGKGPQTSARGGAIEGGTHTKTRKSSGSHLVPRAGDVAARKTAERGGDNRVGHDFVNPSAGKSKSGSHLDQHPNVRKGTSKG